MVSRYQQQRTKGTGEQVEHVIEKEEGKEETEKDETEKKTEEKTEKKEKEEIKEIAALPTSEVEEGKIIHVHTGLYDAQFSTTGATIRSMKLKNYLGEEKKPVELIPEEGKPLSISLIQGDKDIDLTQFPTICEREEVNLKDGLKDSLIFYYTQKDTVFLKKVYVFYPDSYVVDMHIEAVKKVPSSVKLNFDSGIATTEKDKREELIYYSFVAMLGKTFERTDLKKVKEEKSSLEGTINWVGVKSKYFLFCIIPKDTVIKKVTKWSINKERVGLSITTREREKLDFSLYFGPIDYYVLKNMGSGLEKIVYFGWSWIAPIARVIFYIFTGIHKVVPNYGVVIIIFSTIMMAIFFPLTFRSHASMRRMQKLQPKMEAIRKKFKDDPQKMNAEIMKLYSQNKVNPLGGCLPLLLQMPVFFALYAVLRSTIELRRAPFILWIKDLSMRDPYFILPILMGIAMFVQQKFTVTDPRQKFMTYFMPLFLVFIFSRLPSGIVLYWLIYNLLSILQQYLLHRADKQEPPAQEVVEA
jgi:YidC/Oxa1 family membrane protein insertase